MNKKDDALLNQRLESSKKIREKLKAEGFSIDLPWEEVESAMSFNHDDGKKQEQE